MENLDANNEIDEFFTEVNLKDMKGTRRHNSNWDYSNGELKRERTIFEKYELKNLDNKIKIQDK